MFLIITIIQSNPIILIIFFLRVKVRVTFQILEIFKNQSNIISNSFDLYHY